MKTLVTGIAGMIGSHLADRMIAGGWCVTGVDDLSTGLREHVNDDVKFTKGDASVYMRQADYCYGDDLQTERPDVIFHLAARLGPADVLADPLACLHEHQEHAITACELAKATGAILVLASSSEVYGYSTATPFREDAPLLIGPSHLPRCSYAISKLMVEHIGMAYHRQHGVKVIIPRFFNVVGKRQRLGFVLPIFARQALAGQPMTVHGDGSARRCFTWVEDAVEALIRLVDNPEAQGKIVNVGANRPSVQMVTAAKAIRARASVAYGIPIAPIEYVPYETTGDVAWANFSVRIPDTLKLKCLTGMTFEDRWGKIVEDVVDDQAVQLGMVHKEIDGASA